MSAPRQVLLVLPSLCAALVSSLPASVANAQCSHGSGLGPRGSQGLIAQQMLQQQQILQQMQLLQQVRQQQLLQTAKVDRQMRDLAKQGPEALKTALKDPNPEMRLIAVLTVGKYGPALTDDLIERVTDDEPSVRQAARRALVRLSTQRDGKPNKGRNVDFGPAPGSNRVAQGISASKWRSWFEAQQKKGNELKDFALPASVAGPPKTSTPQAPADAEPPAVARRVQKPADE
jgi:hypothetical protein